mmetsp:Transcript_83284/g.193457  ORF Transcript_83284/g.193457 Transcript_83284/m.193457 type:complete len:311 (-) Transcript_83284:183-1115(-)
MRAGSRRLGFGAASLVFVGATFQRCTVDAQVAAWGETDARMLKLIRHHFDNLNMLRARGFECPGGLGYLPNLVPLKFDCRLWRTGQRRLQELIRHGVRADNNASGSHHEVVLVDSNASAWRRQAVAQSISADLPALEDPLQGLQRSAEHCNALLDPRARLAAVAHRVMREQEDKHYWIHLFAAAEVPPDASCLAASSEVVLGQAPSVDVAVAPAGSVAATPAASLANARRLKVGSAAGAASPGDGSPIPELGNTTADEDTYQGPGELFGMVLLIVSMSLFCVCTFGSIYIGNWILSKREERERVNSLEQP